MPPILSRTQGPDDLSLGGLRNGEERTKVASTRTQPVYRFGEFVLDLDARTLRRGTVEVALRPKTFDLLALLVAHAAG